MSENVNEIFVLRTQPDKSRVVYTCIRDTHSTVRGLVKELIYGAPILDMEYWTYIGMTLLVPI
jgi:hypothetical protein